MKNLNNNKNKVLAGTIAALAIVAISVAAIKSIPDNQAVSAANNDDYTAESTASETVTTTDDTKSVSLSTEMPETTAAESATRTETAVTTTQTSVNEPSETLPAETTTKIVEVTLAPVELPDVNVIDTSESYDIQIAETTSATQTAPSVTTSKASIPDGAEGINKYGDYYKMIDGQEYVWDSFLNYWIPEYGEGSFEVCTVIDYGDKPQLEGY